MGRRGTKPAPTAVKLLNGTQRCRINFDEAKAPDGIPAPPSYVTGEAVAFWEEVAPILAGMQVLKLSDRHALGFLADSYRRWREDGDDHKRREEFRKMLAEFGLTPSSRSALKAGTGEAKDALAEFLAPKKA